jgi:hypothetical protein
LPLTARASWISAFNPNSLPSVATPFLYASTLAQPKFPVKQPNRYNLGLGPLAVNLLPILLVS